MSATAPNVFPGFVSVGRWNATGSLATRAATRSSRVASTTVTLHSPNVLHSTCGKQETVTHILLECKNTETPNQIINKTAPLGIKLNLSNILTNELLTDIIIKNLHKRT